LLHKLRSILTMLGIIFGVCSVIAMLAIGEGASYEAQEAIKKLGSNNILVNSIKPAESRRRFRCGTPARLRPHVQDGARLQSTIPGVGRVAHAHHPGERPLQPHRGRLPGHRHAAVLS
jgi:putative ABC transport system permease protein